MPWKVLNVFDQKKKLIEDYLSGHWNKTELASKHNVSRVTVNRVINRFKQEGFNGLKPKSRAPKNIPHKTPKIVVDLLLEKKRKHPHWGPENILDLVARDHPNLKLPAKSTLSSIFKKHNLNKKRKKPRTKHPSARKSPIVTHSPNDVWTIDFKGEFRTLDGNYVYTLTVLDHHTRYLLEAKAFLKIDGKLVKECLIKIFKAFGLPKVIRSDNGSPFASTGIHGLSKLNVWWRTLGIEHHRTRPGCPQDNGAHERMHRTLKKETCLPPKKNLKAQQIAFNKFKMLYNEVRPHQYLNRETPASKYRPSDRKYSKPLTKPSYPLHYLVKRINSAGTFRIGYKLIFISSALEGVHLGLEENKNGIWRIYYDKTILATFDEKDFKIRP